VWHASASAGDPFTARNLVTSALAGVGDAALGEWVERGGTGRFGPVVHVRRRLSVEEAQRVPPLRDIRGTPEAHQRRRALLRAAPALATHPFMRGDPK
jgi:hypothetical protein